MVGQAIVIEFETTLLICDNIEALGFVVECLVLYCTPCPRKNETPLSMSENFRNIASFAQLQFKSINISTFSNCQF